MMFIIFIMMGICPNHVLILQNNFVTFFWVGSFIINVSCVTHAPNIVCAGQKGIFHPSHLPPSPLSPVKPAVGIYAVFVQA